MFCAAGPSQNPVGVYPSNQGFMAPPLPGYMNSLPTKGPPPAGPSCYSANRHQPSPVGTPGALPASPSHRMGPPQASATPPPPSSYSQHPQQPSSWSGATPAPAGNHVSPVPYASGTSTPPVFQNTMQPPAALQHGTDVTHTQKSHGPKH